MNENLLIVLVRNPELGRVKTRLAATVGNENALEIYKKLLEHTATLTAGVKSDKWVFYSDYIDEFDQFPASIFDKYIQSGDSLGDRMTNAIRTGFDQGYHKVTIIGSDCYELTEEIITNAFNALEEKDFTIGPAKDGGYYLLGMNSFHPQLFQNKEWSQENVFLDTMLDVKELNSTCHILPTLSDVDYKEDLGELTKYLIDRE